MYQEGGFWNRSFYVLSNNDSLIYLARVYDCCSLLETSDRRDATVFLKDKRIFHSFIMFFFSYYSLGIGSSSGFCGLLFIVVMITLMRELERSRDFYSKWNSLRSFFFSVFHLLFFFFAIIILKIRTQEGLKLSSKRSYHRSIYTFSIYLLPPSFLEAVRASSSSSAFLLEALLTVCCSIAILPLFCLYFINNFTPGIPHLRVLHLRQIHRKLVI